MTCAHIAASTGCNAVMKELTQFNKIAISAKNKVNMSILLSHDENNISNNSWICLFSQSFDWRGGIIM